jgi:hypothetical protein
MWQVISKVRGSKRTYYIWNSDTGEVLQDESGNKFYTTDKSYADQTLANWLSQQGQGGNSYSSSSTEQYYGTSGMPTSYEYGSGGNSYSSSSTEQYYGTSGMPTSYEYGSGGNTVSSQAPSQMSGAEIARGFAQAFRQAPSSSSSTYAPQGQGGNSSSSTTTSSVRSINALINARRQQCLNSTLPSFTTSRDENLTSDYGLQAVRDEIVGVFDNEPVTFPVYRVPTGRELYRGIKLPCGRFDPEYNFRTHGTWWFWNWRDATNYAPQSRRNEQGQVQELGGCISRYIITEPLTLLDFWDIRVLSIIDMYIETTTDLEPDLVNAYRAYTGIGVGKETQPTGDGRTENQIAYFLRDNGLFDADMNPADYRYNPIASPEPRIQREENRCITWGPRPEDADHSSTRSMDQKFTKLLTRIFPNLVDGVIIPFSAPSTMHRQVHHEIFMFPGFVNPHYGSNKLTFDKERGLLQQGGRKKTRKQKKTKSKTFKQKKSMPK